MGDSYTSLVKTHTYKQSPQFYDGYTLVRKGDQHVNDNSNYLRNFMVTWLSRPCGRRTDSPTIGSGAYCVYIQPRGW